MRSSSQTCSPMVRRAPDPGTTMQAVSGTPLRAPHARWRPSSAAPRGETSPERVGRVTTVVILAATVVGLGLRLYQLTRPGYLLGVTESDHGPDFRSAIRLAPAHRPSPPLIIVQPPAPPLLL